MNFKKTTLPNGLRVITVPTKGNPSAMVLVMVETGSNYETKAHNGLSHFLEHMCFKGTTKRPKAQDIARELDEIGAQNNAFTDHELTGYYAKASKKHFAKLTEIISDLYLNPTLPKEDLEKERGVILQEISMYEDLPQRKVWSVLSKLMYGDTPAGRPVIGPRANIKKFSRQEFVNYRAKHYLAKKTFVVVAGDLDQKEVLKEVKKHFQKIPDGQKATKLKVVEKQKAPQLLVEQKNTDQTHMVMAFRSYAARDKRIPTLMVLTEVLGKGMSSRLWQKMREEMGACYYVRAGHDESTDHGVFSISTGINASRAKEVIIALLTECQKLIQTPVPAKELNKAKEHLLGHLYMNLETTDALAEFYAYQEVVTHKLETPQELEKLVRSVTAKEVMAVAKDLFKNEKLNLAIVGDIKDTKKLKRVLILR